MHASDEHIQKHRYTGVCRILLFFTAARLTSHTRMDRGTQTRTRVAQVRVEYPNQLDTSDISFNIIFNVYFCSQLSVRFSSIVRTNLVA
jgi:hypothetical protein